MAKYKVIFDRKQCIGALSCFGAAPKRFKLAEDTKVDLVGGDFNEETQKWELVFDEDEYEAFKMSEEVCPVKDTIVVEKIVD
jgi:ferredoxin